MVLGNDDVVRLRVRVGVVLLEPVHAKHPSSRRRGLVGPVLAPLPRDRNQQTATWEGEGHPSPGCTMDASRLDNVYA